jgi:hypothetical protein
VNLVEHRLESRAARNRHSNHDGVEWFRPQQSESIESPVCTSEGNLAPKPIGNVPLDITDTEQFEAHIAPPFFHRQEVASL